jgi:hypothetical protein
MGIDPDFLAALGQGLGNADPGIAILAQIFGGGGAPPETPPGMGVQAQPGQPSPVAMQQPEAQVPDILSGALLGMQDQGRDLDAVVGAPDLEQGISRPTSGDLGAQAAAVGQAAQQQAVDDAARDELIRLSGLDPTIAAALTNSQLNTERRARIREDEEPTLSPSAQRTAARQAEGDRRRELEEQARVALAEAQAAGISGPRSVFDVAGRLGTKVEGYTDEEIMAVAAKVTPQGMRKPPKETQEDGKAEADPELVKSRAAMAQEQLAAGMDSAQVAASVRATWPEQADAILQELGISDGTP